MQRERTVPVRSRNTLQRNHKAVEIHTEEPEHCTKAGEPVRNSGQPGSLGEHRNSKEPGKSPGDHTKDWRAGIP